MLYPEYRTVKTNTGQKDEPIAKLSPDIVIEA
jgi:hypothetical protein